MIFWLASYPRSGNLLLRQILYSTMNQRSHHVGGDANEIHGDYSRAINGPLDQFVAEAAEGPERVFVKTHLPPRDEHPAIYVVRDGRAAISSFLKYERTFSPGARSNTMLHLILGDHHFGSWSDHYRAWHGRRRGRILTLRYDQLVDATPAILQEIASFIGYDGEIASWTNPIDEWRKRYPQLVGEGKTNWDPPEEWSFSCDAVFWALHGELMRELQLDDGRRSPAPRDAVARLLAELLPLTSDAIARTQELLETSREKQEMIDALAHERDVQAAAAADRKAALDALVSDRGLQAAAAEERLATIRTLVAEQEKQAAKLSALVDALEDVKAERDLQAEAAEERLALIDDLQRDLQRMEAARVAVDEVRSGPQHAATEEQPARDGG